MTYDELYGRSRMLADQVVEFKIGIRDFMRKYGGDVSDENYVFTEANGIDEIISGMLNFAAEVKKKNNPVGAWITEYEAPKNGSEVLGIFNGKPRFIKFDSKSNSWCLVGSESTMLDGEPEAWAIIRDEHGDVVGHIPEHYSNCTAPVSNGDIWCKECYEIQ